MGLRTCKWKPWGGAFYTLERRPWWSLEKGLHLFWALWEFVIGDEKACLASGYGSGRAPSQLLQGVRRNYTPQAGCKMLLPQTVLSPPSSLCLARAGKQATVESKNLFPSFWDCACHHAKLSSKHFHVCIFAYKLNIFTTQQIVECT